MKKLFISLSVLLGTYLSYGQLVPEPPTTPNAGDIGGPATPIDIYMYVVILLIPFLLLYYIGKKKLNKNYI